MEERAEQVAIVADWLTHGPPLLVVVGEPGVGKTTLLQATMPADALRCRARHADGVVPLGVVRELLRAIGAPEPAPLRALTERMPGPDAGSRLAEAAASLAVLLAGRLVVLDDAHWADAASLRLLGAAVCGYDGAVLAIGTRPWSAEHQPGVAELVATVEAATVPVPALSSAGVRRMLERVVPDRVPSDAELAEIHRRTGGLPLLVESLVGSGGADLEAYVDSALARLGPAAARVVRAVAVLGGMGSIAEVAAVSEADREVVVDALDAAVAAGLLAGGPVPRIRHPLLEELVVANGGPSAARSAYGRAARHAHLAGAAPGRVAALLVHSWPLGEPWAAMALLDGARAARRTADPRLARTLVERAITEQAGDVDVRAEVGTIAAWCGLHLDPPAVAVAGAEEVIDDQERAGAGEWADRTRAELVEFAMLTGDLALASGHARTLLAGAGDDLARQARGLRAFLGATYLETGAEGERLAAVSAAGRLLASDRSDAVPVLAHAAVTFATAGRDAEASDVLERLREVRFERHPQALVDLGLAGVALIQLERLDDAAEVFASVGRVASRHRIDDIAANARAWSARVAAWQGDAGLTRMAAEELARGNVWPVVRPVAAAAVIAGVLLDGTDADVAAALATGRAELAAPAVPEGPGVADLLLACARAEHSLGRPAAAVELVARAAAAYPLADWLAPWPLVALQIGVEPPAVPRWSALGRPISGVLAAGLESPLYPPAGSVAAVALPLPLRSELLLVQGRTLRRAGRRGAARPVLHRALETARSAEHGRLAQAALAELHLAGGRAGAASRPFGLTPAEQRVAVLAAQGRSNRDISEALVVSVKTVESHMARLLTKTGRRRSDLVDVAAEITRLGAG